MFTSIKSLFIVFLIFMIGTPAIAQFKADSLKNIWIDQTQPDSIRIKAIKKYYRNHTFSVPDSVMPVTDLHFTLALENRDYKEMGNAYNEKSYVYYLKGDYENSMNALKRVVEFYEKIDNQKGIAIIYGNMGNIYGGRNEYREALKYFNKTLAIFKTIDNRIGEARMNSSLGIIYEEIGDTTRALKYFDNSIALYNDLELQLRNGKLFYEKASIYFKKKEYVTAYDYTMKALELIDQENNDFVRSNCYFLLAQINNKLNNKEKTIFYLSESLGLEEQFNNNSRLIERYTFQADLLFESDSQKALQEAEEILKLLQKDTEFHLKASLYDLLYRCYKDQNNYRKSLLMHERYSIYNDSVVKQNNNMEILQDAIQREYDDKLQRQELVNEKQNSQLELAHLNKTYSIIGISFLLIFIILIVVFILNKSNNRKKESLLKQIEELKKKKLNSGMQTVGYELNRKKIEIEINRSLNDTDWNVLNILKDDPVISNKDLAKKAFKSVDGIGSSLRRMYEYMDVKDSKYKKISLLMKAIKISNS